MESGAACSAGNTFVRFIDGDAGNGDTGNLAWVSLRDMMAHIDGPDVWTADWDGKSTAPLGPILHDIE